MNKTSLASISTIGPSMTPVAVGDGFGLLHMGSVSSGAGVVLCSPWGIEEISGRKVLFRLATRLAAAGVPTIRFDYPGTADAIDRPANGFGEWVQAAQDAANRLKSVSGVDKIVFAGVGLGAAVAMLAGCRRGDVAGLVLAAPVVSGRRYLREIALGAPVVEEGLGLNASQRPEGVSIGGIVMPPAVATEFKSVDLMGAEAGPLKPALVVHRPAQPQESGLADRLAGLGWPVERTEFEGYELAMDNPTIAVMPERVIEAIARWVGEIVPAPAKAAGSDTVRSVLVSKRYGTDEVLSFGPNLLGILTHPETRTTASTVVFLNSGYDHHAGWAYQWARAANTLAAAGIPSLRFDMANVGDSAAKPGLPEQVLYGDGQQADIASAMDLLAVRGEGPVLLVGRCSGAFAAFQASARDARIAGAVVINPFRLVWDPDEDVETIIRVGPRSMAEYRKRALSGQVFARLRAGDIDIVGVAKSLSMQLGRRIVQTLGPLGGSLSKTVRLRRQCLGMFEAISRRGSTIRMVFSEGDAGLEQMAAHFGSDFRRLRLFPGASMTTVPDADHNMTPQAAQDAVVDIIRDLAQQLAPTAEQPVTADVMSKMVG